MIRAKVPYRLQIAVRHSGVGDNFNAAGFDGFLIQRFEDFCRIKCISIIEIAELSAINIGQEQIVPQIDKHRIIKLSKPQQGQQG